MALEELQCGLVELYFLVFTLLLSIQVHDFSPFSPLFYSHFTSHFNVLFFTSHTLQILRHLLQVHFRQMHLRQFHLMDKDEEKYRHKSQ